MVRGKLGKLGVWKLRRWIPKRKRREAIEDTPMPQDGTRKVKSWPPEGQKLRESISELTFFSLSLALISTAVFIYLDTNIDSLATVDKDNDNNGAFSTISWVVRFGLTASGLGLGFCLNLCREQLTRGSSEQRDAVAYGRQVDHEINKLDSDHREARNTLLTHAQNNDPELSKMHIHFLIKRREDVRSFINDRAGEIQDLGYDHIAFLKEKEENFIRKTKLVDRLMDSVARLSGHDSILKPFVEHLKLVPQLTREYDGTEFQKTVSSDRQDDPKSKT